jgi:hypothetical protein
MGDDRVRKLEDLYADAQRYDVWAAEAVDHPATARMWRRKAAGKRAAYTRLARSVI